MSTTYANTTRRVRRFATIVIVGALALSFAALATLGAGASETGGGIFGSIGDYIAEMAQALGTD
jgi:hypothetical protein